MLCLLSQLLSESRVGTVVRVLASHCCGLGTVPEPGLTCGSSLFLVVVLAPTVFLRVLWFSSLHKNQHGKFQVGHDAGTLLNKFFELLCVNVGKQNTITITRVPANYRER